MMFILAEFFSFLSACCLAYSTFGKTKNKMVFWQAINAMFYALSNILLGGYTAVISNVLTIFRNMLQVKGKYNKTWMILICIGMTSVCLLFNNKGVLGMLPITASVSYTIMMYYVKSVNNMQLAVILNMAQWAVFDFLIQGYPSFVMDIVIIGLSFKNRKKELNL